MKLKHRSFVNRSAVEDVGMHVTGALYLRVKNPLFTFLEDHLDLGPILVLMMQVTNLTREELTYET